MNPVLRDSLAEGRPRYFRASGGAARGKSGREDTEKFADDLMILQECALLVGERLEMNAVSHAIIYDGGNACAFQFDQNSNPANPELVGALVNRRIPMRELLNGLKEYINQR
ncbi:MAG: hypothetical protein HKN23_05610 [Verrucomicrobiales bacterium]|nr:hypothetical protein [Verrucomicrobiales bacterium]